MEFDPWGEANPYLQNEGLSIFCPRCNSDNVVLEEEHGYLKFYSCNECGFKKQKL